MTKWTWTLGVVLGAVMGIACADDESEAPTEEARIACEDFCDKAIECDEALLDDRSECLTDCYGKLDECDDVDELDRGIADIEECAQDCDFFQACSINVDLECFL